MAALPASSTHWRPKNQVSSPCSSAAVPVVLSAKAPYSKASTSAARWIFPLAVFGNSASVTGTSRSGAIPDSRTRTARASSVVRASAPVSQLVGT